MDLRILKTIFKATIDSECLFSHFEKECLKLIGDMANSTDELLVVVLFCFCEMQRRMNLGCKVLSI